MPALPHPRRHGGSLLPGPGISGLNASNSGAVGSKGLGFKDLCLKGLGQGLFG